MYRYDAVLFDLDGTLLNTLDDLTDAVNHTLHAFNHPTVTREKVRLSVGNGVRRLIERVLPGGADWNTRISATASRVCARYWLQTDDGAVICVHNEGLLDAADDPDGFRTTPRFLCALDGPYAFLAEGRFTGTLRALEDGAVEIGVWRLAQAGAVSRSC